MANCPDFTRYQRKPFMVDVINDCGCYHFFAPQKERVEQVISRPFRLDPFIPQWLPIFHQGNAWVFAWTLVGIRFSASKPWGNLPIPSRISGALQDAESLSHENDLRESILTPKESPNAQKGWRGTFSFPWEFPKSVPCSQRGHQAIEFVGRAHFDDPDLFDQNLSSDSMGPRCFIIIFSLTFWLLALASFALSSDHVRTIRF